MRYKLIAVVSQDGFIGKFSGHKPHEWSSQEEQKQFKIDINTCNWSVMGKVTHKLEYNKDRYRIIFTSSVSKIVKMKKHIFFNPTCDDFSEITKYFKPYENIGILGGTKVHDFFWKKELITDIILTIEPIFFYKGLYLFTAIDWFHFQDEINKNSFKLKKKKQVLNKQGTIYLHYTR